jgi:hypothetical protein
MMPRGRWQWLITRNCSGRTSYTKDSLEIELSIDGDQELKNERSSCSLFSLFLIVASLQWFYELLC